ncbi:hypothetical protein BB561_001913 [Smittium simulii]|uniref:Transcription factor CBF/NF-Y/archaeal histone domain-containing protein n=1 Tax=Smittium simulii TaxID=133385 RepID=A0A2T9YSH3_9FUNG|nr:hypothetical protein BB561_001913 [Smittium simulii]
MSLADQHQAANASDEDVEIKEQDRFLPIANVARIMKRSLPENAKISKEAKEAVQECVSEFISFVTSEASERCQQEKRKTINGEDILWAMHSLGFENYSDALKLYLSRYREVSKPEKEEHNKDEESIFDAQSNAAAAVAMAVQAQAQAQASAEQGLQESNLAMYMSQASANGSFY